MNSGLIGGIIGGAIGVVGGIVGSYYSLRSAKTPRERRFMRRVGIACWVAVSLLVTVSLSLPSQYRHYIMIPYMLGLALVIVWGNRRLQAIRREDDARGDDGEVGR